MKEYYGINQRNKMELLKKLREEQKRYRDWLLTQAPEEILKHTCEYTAREDIVLSMEDLAITGEQAELLLSLQSPLEDLCKDYQKMDTGNTDIILNCLENRLSDIRKRRGD